MVCLVSQRTSMPTLHRKPRAKPSSPLSIKLGMRRDNFGKTYEASINSSNLVCQRCSTPARIIDVEPPATIWHITHVGKLQQYNTVVQGGLRRGGLVPAATPRMPANVR